MTALVLVALLLPQRVLINTSAGDMVVAVDDQLAPRTAAQFAKLVSLGLYDSTRFLRVQRSVLIQVAVVESRRKQLSDPERAAAIEPLPLESGPAARHRRGVLTMSRDESSKREGSSSFAILLADAPSLDGRYTVFGHVERGMEVADNIGEADVDFGNVPVAPIEILHARLLGPDEHPTLAPAVPLTHRTGLPPHIPWFVGTMTLLCLGALLTIQRNRPRLAAGLCVLAAFVGSFLLFTLLLPAASRSRWLSLLLLGGLVLSFRLVSGFEKAR